MPELPEVETTRRGILPHLAGRRIEAVMVRDARLRWPVPPELVEKLRGRRIDAISRRGKYLLLHAGTGYALVHLGMSGSLRIVDAATPLRKHDHLDLRIEGGGVLRFHDPRRFGAFLWGEGDPALHPLLRDLGPEPLEAGFDGGVLAAAARGRKTAIKHLIMDAGVVVGVGNIYANEALFMAGIHPLRAAGRVARPRLDRLAGCIRTVLGRAIEQGGTTLRDYVNGHGEPGYFSLELAVYDRAGEPCRACAAPVRMVRSGQRSTYYCPACQR